MSLTGLFYPWGLILQAIAILHFVQRRPDTYWLWIILIGGGLGALVYIAAEADQQRVVEAREWAGRILAKKPTMPRYLRRRERPWFRKAAALVKRLPAQ